MKNLIATERSFWEICELQYDWKGLEAFGEKKVNKNLQSKLERKTVEG